jgi:hypothetical protein
LKPRFEGGVFNTVRDTIQKLAFGEDDSSPLDNELISMNIAPIMGRRDAAYDRAVHLLRDHLFSYSEEGRSQIYTSVIELLNISIEMSKLIAGSTKTRKDNILGPFIQYLQLLNDTVKASASMVRHEIILFAEERDLSDFLGREISSQFRSTDEIFSNSEMSIYQCISELVDIADPAILRYREFRRKSFSKNNLTRYEKSLSEYSRVYTEKDKLPEKEKTV